MPRTHQEIDARSLALHRLIAERIQRDPSLFEVAKRNLAHWRTHASPNETYYVEEWDRLLQSGLDAALAVAIEDSEYATALRQSSPFAGVLTPRERWAFLDAWKVAHEAH